jgi:hypothetical protein
LPDTIAPVCSTHSTSSYFDHPYPACCPVRPGYSCFLCHVASLPWPPGPTVLSKLSSSSAITCPRGRDDSLCHACQLGRHARFPFPISSTRAVQPFDLIHCDLWTSSVLSVSSYKYYMVILDDCIHYSWTFLLRQKSDIFPTLSHFFTFVSTQFGRTIRSV